MLYIGAVVAVIAVTMMVLISVVSFDNCQVRLSLIETSNLFKRF